MDKKVFKDIVQMAYSITEAVGDDDGNKIIDLSAGIMDKCLEALRALYGEKEVANMEEFMDILFDYNSIKMKKKHFIGCGCTSEELKKRALKILNGFNK